MTCKAPVIASRQGVLRVPVFAGTGNMKVMRLSAVLAASIVISLSACGGNEGRTPRAPAPTPTPTFPAISEVALTQAQIEEAAAFAVEGTTDPWGTEFALVLDRALSRLGVRLGDSQSAALNQLDSDETDCFRNYCADASYCGFPSNSRTAPSPFYVPAVFISDCLNRTCYAHDLDSFDACVSGAADPCGNSTGDPNCYFSPQSDGPDAPFFPRCVACAVAGSLSFNLDRLVCAATAAMKVARQGLSECQDPPSKPDDCQPAPLPDRCTEVECNNNGVLDLPSEQCDGSDLDGTTCQDFDFQGGTLSCTAACRFDTSDCASGLARLIVTAEQCTSTCPEGDVEDCLEDLGGTGAFDVLITEEGSRLSGEVLAGGFLSGICDIISCDPATPLCVERRVLEGSASGGAVEFTVSFAQSGVIDCGFGPLSFSTTGHATFEGSREADGTIRGSFVSETDQSCEFSEFLECCDVSEGGSFELRL